MRLSLLLLLFYSAFASGTETCPISYESGVLQSEQLKVLITKGYQPRAVRSLRNDVWSLRQATDTNLWALVPTKAGFNLYFELPAGSGEVPLMRYAFPKVEVLPACEEVTRKIKLMREVRFQMRETFPALRKEGRLLEAFLQIEEMDAHLKGLPYPSLVVKRKMESIRNEAEREWRASEGKPMSHRLHAIRKVLLTQGLASYCKSAPRFRDLTTRTCTNCVGQSLLWLGILDFLKAEDAQNKFGFVLYHDHIQPAWINPEGVKIDLMYNKKIDPLLEVQNPRRLVALGVQRWRNLILPSDSIPSDAFDGVSAPQGEVTEILRNGGKEGSVYEFSRLAKQGVFSQEEVPENADLSDLMNLDPDAVGNGNEEPGGAKKGNEPFGGANCYYVSPGSASYIRPTLHPEDQKLIDKYLAGGPNSCQYIRSVFERKNPFAKLRKGELDTISYPGLRLFQNAEYVQKSSYISLPYMAGRSRWQAKEQKGNDYFLVFSDPAQFEEYKSMRYVSRMDKIAGELRAHVVENVRPALEKMNSLLRAKRPVAGILANYDWWMEAGRDLQTVLYLGDFLIVRTMPELREAVTVLADGLSHFAERARKESAPLMGELNSMTEQDAEKFLLALNVLPGYQMAYIETHLGRPQAIAEQRFLNNLRLPLEGLFTQTLRNPDNWVVSSDRAELRVPRGPKQGFLGNLTGLELPEVSLPCGEHGYLVVVCPETAPVSGEKTSLKPHILARLALMNPHVFYNPGDLLLLSELWSPEVEAEFKKAASTWPNGNLLWEPNLDPADKVLIALKEKTKIIRGESRGNPGIRECARHTNHRVECKLFLSQETMQDTQLVQSPSWIRENPLFAKFIDKVPLEAKRCRPMSATGELTAWNPFASGEIRVDHIRPVFEEYDEYLIQTNVGKKPIAYHFITVDRQCSEKIAIEPIRSKDGAAYSADSNSN